MLIHLIGGFLGSGKTTAIHQACKQLHEDGKNVAVITNDQGKQLVDTDFLTNEGITTEEVVGSCFCCNYKAFEGFVTQLDKQLHPEVIFAESVGSCTDLIATIMWPLGRYHPEKKVVLSVFADAQVLPVLVSGSSLFANSVNYIYKKQLEEADILVLSKCDLLSEHQWELLRAAIADHFSDKTVLFHNSYEPQHIQRWLETASSFQQEERKALDLDYKTYGAGEAELAWVNQGLYIQSASGMAIQGAQVLVEHLYGAIRKAGHPIGHLKFICKGENIQEKISFTSSSKQEERLRLPNSTLTVLNLLINARVQTSPDKVLEIIGEAVEKAKQLTDCSLKLLNQEAFIPGFPSPTYRILDEIA